jgi:hypothetical protein
MRLALVALAGVTVVAGALAVAALRAPPPPQPVAAPTPAPAPSGPRADPTPTLADAVQRVIDPPPEPETLRSTPVVGRADAEADFDALMDRLDALADAGTKLPRARRDEIYRNVNDAFSGLSATLDPNSEADMQLLEDANIRMKAMLHELGVRVPLRPPQAP